jgi:beta-glucosidase-like glycosyl hydrolase
VVLFVCCNGPLLSCFRVVVEAIKQGKLSEALVRERIKPLFYTRMRLGEFDPAQFNPYSRLNLSLVQSPQHQQLSLEAAMKSFVLLKNRNNFLPLPKKKYNKIAVSIILYYMSKIKLTFDIDISNR